MSLELTPRHRVYKENDIYECVACNKLYTEDMLAEHEDKCEKIPAFLEWLATQETDNESL